MNFNNETYFEFDEAFEDPWTRVPNTILDDTRVSAKAIGIYTKIVRFQNSNKHKIYINSITKQLKDGKDSVRSGIKELLNLGYISRVQIRNDRGFLAGFKYTVYVTPTINENDEKIKTCDGESVGNTPSEPSSENPTSDKLISEKTSHKKKIGLKENVLKENKGVGGGGNTDEKNEFKSFEEQEELVKEDKILKLYKAYGIQQRLMPQMKKILLAYMDKIDIEVYEEIFMLASEDNVKSKYGFIKDLLERFCREGIFTLEDYKKDCKRFKEDKKVNTSKDTKKGYKGQKNGSKDNKIKTRYHGVCSTIDKMSANELKETVAISQYVKMNNEAPIRNVYYRALKEGLHSLSTDDIRQSIINYAVEKNLEVPN